MAAATQESLVKRPVATNETISARGLWHRIRTAAYWVSTIFLTLELVAGSLWAMLQIPFNQAQLHHLGYPSYIDLILGPWKLAGAAALIAPRFPRLKEWAYAAFFFNCYGALASHLFAGDAPRTWTWAFPLVLVALIFVSWSSRPADRRLPDAAVSSPARLADWAIPIAIFLALLVFASLTIPTGRGEF